MRVSLDPPPTAFGAFENACGLALAEVVLRQPMRREQEEMVVIAQGEEEESEERRATRQLAPRRSSA